MVLLLRLTKGHLGVRALSLAYSQSAILDAVVYKAEGAVPFRRRTGGGGQHTCQLQVRRRDDYRRPRFCAWIDKRRDGDDDALVGGHLKVLDCLSRRRSCI